MVQRRLRALLVLTTLVAACSKPEARPETQPEALELAVPAPSASSTASASPSMSATSIASSAAPSGSVVEEGTAPSEPGAVLGEQKMYALGIETFVRALNRPGSRALGYLRVGASIRRSDEPAGKDGCKGGWYAIEPTGFICHDDASSLDAEAKLVQLAQPLPKRGEPMPYVYARVKAPTPHYYAKLPTREDQRKVEGAAVAQHAATGWHNPDANLALLGAPSALHPLLLSGDRMPRPPGAAPRLRFWAHTGRAEPNTRLAFLTYFEHENRRFGMTSQLDLVALDRIKILKPPEFHGTALSEEQTLPVAFVRPRSAVGKRFDDAGKVLETVALGHRQALALSGNKRKQQSGVLLESSEGVWVLESQLIIVPKREQIPTFVKNDTLRWIDISIREQSLVAYVGSKPVYATLVSTGSGFMGDPETTHATPRGLYSIFSKHVSTKMSGDELGGEYQIDDVPYVQYFHRGYALHGAFWHDNFGRVQSHGCVNLAPADAAWVFEFTGPELPEGWHGRYVKSGGTPVLIRP